MCVISQILIEMKKQSGYHYYIELFKHWCVCVFSRKEAMQEIITITKVLFL